LSHEVWWTGSPIAIFEMKTGWKLPRFLDGLVHGILFYIENSLLLWERMRYEKDKMLYKIALHQKLLFLQKYPEPHILQALYLISPFRW
jgi:hypothetical protein